MLLFVDESGQDHKDMPYEVLAGVSVAEENLWNLVKAIRSAEKEHFGDYLRNLRCSEVKAQKLLKKKTFRLAAQRVVVPEEELSTLAGAFLRKGVDAHERGLPDSNPTAKEITAYARTVIRFVEQVLDIAAGFDVRVFASIINVDDARTRPDLLQKDMVYLFERYFYYLESLEGRNRGLVVFDEIDKSKAQQLIQQMAKYFLGTETGKFRSSRIIPEPFFVHSELTTGIFLADLAAYIIGWGWRCKRMKKAHREELRPLADKLQEMQFRGTKPKFDDPSENHTLFGINYIDKISGKDS